MPVIIKVFFYYLAVNGLSYGQFPGTKRVIHTMILTQLWLHYPFPIWPLQPQHWKYIVMSTLPHGRIIGTLLKKKVVPSMDSFIYIAKHKMQSSAPKQHHIREDQQSRSMELQHLQLHSATAPMRAIIFKQVISVTKTTPGGR